MNMQGEALLRHGVEFTISQGSVTGMELVVGNKTVPLHIPAGATFAVSAGAIAETIPGRLGSESLNFVADPAKAGLFHLASDTFTVSNPSPTDAHGNISAYGFTIAQGAVTAMHEIIGNAHHTNSHNVRIASTEAFSISGNTVTETLVQGDTIETIRYVTTGPSGLYAIASDSTTFIAPGTATPLLSVEGGERAKFVFDASHKITEVDMMLPNGSSHALRADPLTTFTLLAPGYVVETHTAGTRSSYEVFHDGNGDGIYTAVAHGSGTVDLVGLKSQINAAIELVT
jgi:hypothetical protein